LIQFGSQRWPRHQFIHQPVQLARWSVAIAGAMRLPEAILDLSGDGETVVRWRRLALLTFPFTFRKPGEPVQGDHERRGDPTLKSRIKRNLDQQHDAIVTWAVEGAMKWYANPETSLQPTHKINTDTRAACNS
jgi:hypothetical protein